VRLLLDEMWTPTIALELRKRGLEVIAITEPAHSSRYAGISDDEVFARAQDDGHTVVTDNIADYEQATLLAPVTAAAGFAWALLVGAFIFPAVTMTAAARGFRA
jgi:hypothetical protein